MERSASNQTNPENNESQESKINSYIKQFTTLQKSVEKSNKELEYWRNQKLKLLESNCNIQMNIGKLSQKASDIQGKISENTRIQVAKKQELKDLQSARTNMMHKQWNDRLSRIGSYANDFSQWITTYSKNVLMKEIENHQAECRQVGEELAILKQDLDDMRKECDWDYVEANVDDYGLSNFNRIISNNKSSNNNLMKNIRLKENELNKIQNKIKQSKAALDEFKAKEKENVF